MIPYLIIFFLPKSKEVYHLRQCSLDNIVGKVTSIAQETLFRVERCVSCTLSASGVSMSEMDGNVYKSEAIMVLSNKSLGKFYNFYCTLQIRFIVCVCVNHM